MLMRRLFPLGRLFSTATATHPIAPVTAAPFDPHTVNPEDYRDLHRPVKFRTGYATLQVEPFPRLKIMELGRFLLANLAKDIPEDALQRLFMEEHVKYIMELTHETPNVLDLEMKLGTDCIELFIDQMADYMKLVDVMRDDRIWETEPLTPDQVSLFQRAKTPYDTLMEFEKTAPRSVKPLLDDK